MGIKSLPDYHDRYNLDLLTLIPPDANSILEIGCGTGQLYVAFKRINPHVKWAGVESDIDSQYLACKQGIDCIWEDVENIDFEETPYSGECFDALVFGDVLEHLNDPAKVIEDTFCLLKPGGQVLACIPNAQHWHVQRTLARGDWPYNDDQTDGVDALFDRGHLRWFTKKTMIEMFERAGLQILEVIPRLWGVPPDDWRIKDAAELAGQYLIRAVKPPCEIKPLRIHAVVDGTVCTRQRIEEPLGMLRTIPGVHVSTASIADKLLPILAEEDAIVIFQRTCSKQFPMPVDVFRSRVQHILTNRPRAVIVYEIDDHPDILIDPGVMAMCHAVQCSTEPLAELCRQWNPTVEVFPNQIADLPPRRGPKVGYPTIWYSAQNRRADWEPIMAGLNEFLKGRREIGVSVMGDREFYEALETECKEFFPFSDYATHRAELRRCEIAILPLQDTPFNRCKSDLKFWECVAESVIPVCSINVARATGVIDDIPMGLMFDDPGCVRYPIEYLIGTPTFQRNAHEALYRLLSQNRLLSQHYRCYHDWYLSLIQRKPELDRALLDRCPTLRVVPVQPDPQSTPA